jgi:predicted ATPase
VATLTGRTLTFLFTDIEDSTRRWQEDRDGMAASLAAHDATLVRVIEASGGRVFKHTGDGMCSVFESAASAVTAANVVQQQIELPVRVGVHTGEAEERDGDFYGMTLNRCARIMDAGHGGQVLLSSVTAGLFDGAVVDLGEYVLKGVNEPERILQLGAAIFPPLRVANRGSALPSVLTSLVGREELVDQIVERLATARLVTLVGVGGVGKTRVALAAAQRLESDRDLTAFVPLSEVSDEDEVLPALARVLGLTTPTLDAVSIALSGRSALIVLDNCEHVIDAVADLVEEILAASVTVTVTVLATSREGLVVDGEQLIAVPGLDGSGDDAAAVALFVDRARSVAASFELDADGTAVVAEICRRLDGLPLAIELAAARANVLSPQDLLARLDERFDVLTSGRRRRSRDRQKTLRETVDWSYELLDGDEQRAFEQLSVFAGSFGLDGAQTVLDAVTATDVLDLVESLVSKSLLSAAVVDGFHRYRYLETIRSYAEEQLDAHGSTADVVDRLHGYLVAEIGESIDQILNGPLSGADRIRVEIPNLRRALDHALALGDVNRAGSLVIPFAGLRGMIDWRIHGWADEVLALPGAVGSPEEADLLALRSIELWLGNRFGELKPLLEEMMRVAEAGPRVSFGVHMNAVHITHLLGNDVRTLELTEIYRSSFGEASTGPDGLEVFARHVVTLLPTDPDAPSVEYAGLDDDLAASDASASEHSHANAAFIRAIRAYTRGDFEEMREQSELAVQLGVVGSGNWFGALQTQAWSEYELGRFSEAIRTVDENIDQAYRHGDRSALIVPLAVYAIVLKAFDELEAVAIIRGRLPRRLTMLMVRELAEIDRWLASELPADRRLELASIGAEMDPRALQALVHEAAARRLDPSA